MLKQLLLMVSAILFTVFGMFFEKPHSASPGPVLFDGSSECMRCDQKLTLDSWGKWQHDNS